MPRLLIIGHTFPESSTTAAGARIIQLTQCFRDAGYEIVFATTASHSTYSDSLLGLTDQIFTIHLNDSRFDDLIVELSPDLVLFDRFMTEEQFGWRVAEKCPNALRILETQDLHFLRKAREKAVRSGLAKEEAKLTTDQTFRELASIYRCDLSIIISLNEMRLLTSGFDIPSHLLHYFPLYAEPVNDPTPFDDRLDFVAIGNFRHRPNTDAVLWLKEEIWPLIRKQLPVANLNIYGAYVPLSITNLHDEQSGFHIRGWAPSMAESLGKAKVNLAPLRFGAGLKGKVIDSLSLGTPVVTTAIGAEGIFEAADLPGCLANNPQDIAKAAVELYSDSEHWKQTQKKGLDLISSRFDKAFHTEALSRRISVLAEQGIGQRLNNTVGMLLHYHGLQSTRYLSKWIECKNSDRFKDQIP